MKKILITAFEPFGKHLTNASMLVLEQLPHVLTLKNGTRITLIKAILPVSFKSSKTVLKTLLDLHQPDVLLSLGLAENRNHLTFERVALNLMDARIPDNDAFQPIDVACEEKGEIAYFSTLPVKKMIAACAPFVPTKISETAGTYVCNALMYQGLYWASRTAKPFLSGFAHLPPESVLSPDLIAKALQEAIKLCFEQ